MHVMPDCCVYIIILLLIIRIKIPDSAQLLIPSTFPTSLLYTNSEQAGVSLGDSHSFQVHHVYEDSDIHSLLQAASDILGKREIHCLIHLIIMVIRSV